MISLKYKAKGKNGQTVEGFIEAEDINSGIAALQEEGYFILDVKEVRERRRVNWNPVQLLARWTYNPIFGGATIRDLALFYRQLATMMKSGMSLGQAMNSLSEQGANRRLRQIAADTKDYIQEGGRLSDAFARYPWMFSELQIGLLRAGESGGTLDRMLERIADYLDREHRIRQSLRLATLYPKILILAVIFIPKAHVLIMDGFKPYMKETLGVLAPILIVLVILWAVFRLLSQIPAFRYVLDCAKVALPKLGTMVRMLALSKFYRVLAAMLSAGASVSQGITHAANATGNWFLRNRLMTAMPAIEQGASFSESFARTGVVPRMALDMLATGEQTGSIDSMLDKTAEYTESEAEVATIQATLILGVILLLCAAVYIGLFVIRFYSGMYSGLLEEQM